MSSEEELNLTLELYQQQLDQINTLLSDDPNNSDVLNLQNDLTEIIKLTQESLLEVKKKKLLSELNKLEKAVDKPTSSNALEDTNQSENSDEDEEDSDTSSDDSIDLDCIVGSRCRVPFDCPITNIKVHDAIVIGVSSLDENTIKVIFCHPTEPKMRACKYFLEGNCKFDKDCKFSHGYEVNVDDLQTYVEPDYDDLEIGKQCLAKDTDNLWHLATVESIDPTKVCVQLKQFNKKLVLPLESIHLIDESVDEVNKLMGNKRLDGDDFLQEKSTYDNDEIITTTFEPRNMSSVNKRFANMGEWEKYTKGIGSKLLSKMGYVAGKGLGSKGEGRVDPIDIYVLPAGKSLDKIMELKEKKQLKKEKFKIKEDKPKPEENDEFEFINKTLAKDKSTKQDDKTKQSFSPSKKTTTKDLNIQMLKTHEEIKNVEKTISKLKESLVRNKNGDKATVEHLKQKLLLNEKTLSQLRKNEANMQNKRTNLKQKSDIF